MDDSLHSPAALSTAAELAREERRKKGRVRHAPHQTAALNEVFQRTDHPSLQERQTLAKQLGMETKVVNSWFQNKRAAIRKRVERQSSQPPLVVRKGATVAVKEEVADLAPRSQHPSLPPISSLLRPPPHDGSVGGDSDYEDDDERPVQLPPIQDRPRVPSPFFDPVRQAASSQSLRSVSANYTPSRSFGIPHKRSLDEAELPSRASLPPPSAFHPSLRSNYLSPVASWSRLPDLHLDTIGGRSVSGFPDTASERSRTPSSVYGDDFVHRNLPPLSQLSRAEDDVAYSEKSERLSLDTSPAGLLPQPSPVNTYKVRSRPTSFQAEELRKLYESNSHPTREEKQRLAEVTGLRLQSITNWFQNQRSTAKRRRGGDSLETASLYSRDSPLPSPSDIALRNARIVSGGARPRRSRPEPHQLEALKRLYERTSSPSIEQRGALALEVGMEVSKVTNWFRNLRQTAKKRAKSAATSSGQGAELDDDDFDMDAEDEAGAGSIGSVDSRGPSVAVFSRGATPVAAAGSPAYTEVDELMDDIDDHEPPRSAEHMDVEEHGSNSHETGSDEEEAVTPSPRSPARSLPYVTSTPGVDRHQLAPKPPTSAERVNNTVSVEDAVLLLGLRNRSSPQ